MNEVKIEESCDDREVKVIKHDDEVPTQRRKKWKGDGNHVSVRKMMKIAKLFADLHCNAGHRPFQLPLFRGSEILQCPACMIPRRRDSNSAFVELLEHVSRRHPQFTKSLFVEIRNRCMPLIDKMASKVISRLKVRFSRRLANQRRRTQIPDDDSYSLGGKQNVCNSVPAVKR